MGIIAGSVATCHRFRFLQASLTFAVFRSSTGTTTGTGEQTASEATDQGIARAGDEFEQLLLPAPLEGDQAPDAEVGVAAHRVRVDADRRRDADLEPGETARTPEIACRLLETSDAARRLVDIERESVPARRMAERAPEGLGRVSADCDRRMGRLGGPWPRLDAAKREELTMILWLVLRPDREHRLEVLYRALPLVGERDAQRVELGLQKPDPDAEDQAPAGDNVDARELLRQHQGIALRQDDDPGTELHALGVRRDERERDGRIEKRALRVEVLSEAAPRSVADAVRHGRGRHLRVRVRDVESMGCYPCGRASALPPVDRRRHGRGHPARP